MYSRTQNENGTYNTRCLDCFLTVASCIETERDIDVIEARHVCPEKVLHQLQEYERITHMHDSSAHSAHG